MIGLVLASAAVLAFSPNLAERPARAPAGTGAALSNASAKIVDPTLGLQVVTFSGAMPAKWRDVIDRHEKQLSGGGAQWGELTGQLRQIEPSGVLQWVNQTVNRIRYVSDSQNWGISDYWATPLEAFARGGDCEDYAIAKYMLLREAGYRSSQMEIAISKDHAVLVIQTASGPIVLDNLRDEPFRLKTRLARNIVYTVNDKNWSVVVG